MVDSSATQTIINNPELLKSLKIKYTLINFLNYKINDSNISGKLKIKIGSEILNIDNAILFQNGRRNLLSIIDLLDNNINCLFLNKNNKKYLELFKDNIEQLKIYKVVLKRRLRNTQFNKHRTYFVYSIRIYFKMFYYKIVF